MTSQRKKPYVLAYKALAPNGRLYMLHHIGNNRGFVYAWGHRVYGDIGMVRYSSEHKQYVRPFTPTGKWAFIVQPHEDKAVTFTH